MTQATKGAGSIMSPRPSHFYKARRIPSLNFNTQPTESPLETEDIYGRMVDHLNPRPLESERSQEAVTATPPLRSDRFSTLGSLRAKKPEHSPSVKVISYPVFFSKSRRTLHKNLSEKQLTLIKKIDPVKYERTQTNFKPKEKEKEKPSNAISKKSTFYNIKLKTPLSSERSSHYDGFSFLNNLRSPQNVVTEPDNIQPLKTKLAPLNVVSIKPLTFRPTEKQLNKLKKTINYCKTREVSEDERDRMGSRE